MTERKPSLRGTRHLTNETSAIDSCLSTTWNHGVTKVAANYFPLYERISIKSLVNSV